MARPQTISDDQILKTACRCFLEHGPGVSTETIASELGVSAQALLKRFRTKRELLLASVLPPETASWTSLVESGPDDRPLTVQLSEIVERLAEYYLDIARRMSVLQFAGFSPKDLEGRYRELPPLRNIRIVAGWFERAARRGLIRVTDCQVAALTVLCALHGPAMLTRFLGRHPTGHSSASYVDAVVDLIINGLRTDQPPEDEAAAAGMLTGAAAPPPWSGESKDRAGLPK